jgi:hypothetical protein
MISLKNLTLTLSSILILSACSPSNPKKEAPLDPVEATETSASLEKIDVVPKVDILVVVDYSTSMGVHQENLAANIDGFVNAFSQNKLIDFHLAVTTIWDSYHCGRTTDKGLFTPVLDSAHPYDDLLKKNKDDYFCFPRGELLPLKNPNYVKGDATKPMALEGPRYVTRNTENYLEIIKHTLLVGQFKGPAYEENFTPVMPALTEFQGAGQPNAGFYRTDAYTIVIFITDADAGSNELSPRISAESLKADLVSLKGGNSEKILAVGVVSPTNQTCPKDPQALSGPFEIEKFLKLTGNKELSLCSPSSGPKSFGAQLAKIGSDLTNKISPQVIQLRGCRDYNKPFEVRFGKQLVSQATAPDFTDGWSYDYDSCTLTIGPNTKLSSEGDNAGATLSILYTTINSRNGVNGRVKKL